LAGVGGRQLAVYDLTKQFSQVLKLTDDDNMQFGHAVWSPDGKKIVLTAARNPCSDETRYDTLLVDVETMTLTTLIANDDHLFVPTGWENAEHVILKDKEHIWLLNVHTRSLKRENQA
jgi:Tol biopolymer transport system component